MDTFAFVNEGRSFVAVFDTLESMYQLLHWWHWLTYGNAFPNAVALQALTGAVSALAAIAAGVFAYRAYRATREQLLLLRTQTNAMLMGERPWVTLEVSNWTPGIQTFGNLEAAHLMPMMLALKNVGRTPARIEALAFDATVVDSLEDLPPEPVYPPADQEFARFLSSDHSLQYRTRINTSNLLKSEFLADVQWGKKHFFAYGYVRYRDLSDQVHETRSGFVYTFAWGNAQLQPRLTISQGGPASYNRAT